MLPWGSGGPAFRGPAPAQGRKAGERSVLALLGCLPLTSRQGAPWPGSERRARGGPCGERSSHAGVRFTEQSSQAGRAVARRP